MFYQLLAVSMGRSHVVAWPGRPLGGQSSAPAVTESPRGVAKTLGPPGSMGIMRASSAWQALLRDAGAGRGPPGGTLTGHVAATGQGHPCRGHCRLSHHACSDPLSLCPDTELGTPRLPRPSAQGMPPPAGRG